jgi:hypothetical protein
MAAFNSPILPLHIAPLLSAKVDRMVGWCVCEEHGTRPSRIWSNENQATFPMLSDLFCLSSLSCTTPLNLPIEVERCCALHKHEMQIAP